MSQADDFTPERNELNPTESLPTEEVSGGEAQTVVAPVRRMSARRLALQGPLLVLALAGIGFGGAMNWESRDQWRELITGKPASLTSAESGGGCPLMRASCGAAMRSGCSSQSSCSSQAAVAGSCCQGANRAAAMASACSSSLQDAIATFVKEGAEAASASDVATEPSNDDSATAQATTNADEEAKPSDDAQSEAAETDAQEKTAEATPEAANE